MVTLMAFYTGAHCTLMYIYSGTHCTLKYIYSGVHCTLGIRDVNLSTKFLSGQFDNFLALSGQCPDNWTIFEFLVNRLSTK